MRVGIASTYMMLIRFVKSWTVFIGIETCGHAHNFLKIALLVTTSGVLTHATSNTSTNQNFKIVSILEEFVLLVWSAIVLQYFFGSMCVRDLEILHFIKGVMGLMLWSTIMKCCMNYGIRMKRNGVRRPDKLSNAFQHRTEFNFG